MPLTRICEIVCDDYRLGIGFTMRDGATRVIVWVDKGALLILSDKSPGRSNSVVFERYREMLEAIASANYDAGIIEPDGSTIIRRDDVVGLG